MSRKYRLIGTDLGTDLTNVALYHTEITASNLLVASITSSLLESTGVVVEIPDDVTVILSRCLDGDCSARTGSLTIRPYTPNTRYFDVFSDGQGYVFSVLPTVTSPVTSSFTAEVNYTVHSVFVVEADNSYYPGYQFQGWYNDVSGSGTLLSSNTQLSIGQNDFTASLTGDKLYAYFG